jgi:hypothetical protein
LGAKKLSDFFPLSNTDINEMMYARVGKKYNGCFARHVLPSRLTNGYYVINLDDIRGGTHWVGMKVDGREIVYFDSFGFICPQEVIERRGKRDIWYSTHEIQNAESVSCGYYVVYFLSELEKNRDKVDILLDFTNDSSILNDQRLKDLMF